MNFVEALRPSVPILRRISHVDDQSKTCDYVHIIKKYYLSLKYILANKTWRVQMRRNKHPRLERHTMLYFAINKAYTNTSSIPT